MSSTVFSYLATLADVLAGAFFKDCVAPVYEDNDDEHQLWQKEVHDEGPDYELIYYDEKDYDEYDDAFSVDSFVPADDVVVTPKKLKTVFEENESADIVNVVTPTGKSDVEFFKTFAAGLDYRAVTPEKAVSVEEEDEEDDDEEDEEEKDDEEDDEEKDAVKKNLFESFGDILPFNAEERPTMAQVLRLPREFH